MFKFPLIDIEDYLNHREIKEKFAMQTGTGSFTVMAEMERRTLYIKFKSQRKRGCPRGVIVKAMDCGIVVSEFVLQWRYYVHFRANTLGKGINPLILPVMG